MEGYSSHVKRDVFLVELKNNSYPYTNSSPATMPLFLSLDSAGSIQAFLDRIPAGEGACGRMGLVEDNPISSVVGCLTAMGNVSDASGGRGVGSSYFASAVMLSWAIESRYPKWHWQTLDGPTTS